MNFIIIHVNVRENRRSNKEWTIQRNWPNWVHDTVTENIIVVL